VPVNEDGSAYFKVPARTSLQLQILDESGRAMLTEKSLFYLQPGESRSCVGCHALPESSRLPGRQARRPECCRWILPHRPALSTQVD